MRRHLIMNIVCEHEDVKTGSLGKFRKVGATYDFAFSTFSITSGPTLLSSHTDRFPHSHIFHILTFFTFLIVCWSGFCVLFCEIKNQTVLRYLIFLAGIAFVGSSCSSLKSTSRSSHGASSDKTQNTSPKFLNDIAISSDPPSVTRRSDEVIPHMPENYKSSQPYMFPAFNIEQGGPLQFKYAIKMNVEVERLANRDLYKFIESWWGTPYRMGGSTQKGVDCSAFTQTLMSVIYGLEIPRTAREQKASSAVVGEDELREGDLVFFNTRGRGVSHVGIYLLDNQFVHASSSSGVMISNLNDSYWHKRFITAGRVVDEQTAAAVSLQSR